MKSLIILFLSLILSTYAKDVCYSDLGCFTDSYPFSSSLQRPLGWLPETPEKVGTKFALFTRQNNADSAADGERIDADHPSVYYNASLPTKFIIHGFLHHAKKPWVVDIKNALLKIENVNVITVDWSRGNGFPYTQATANTQVVGAEIAKLIKSFMRTQPGVTPANFHIIGHSLGSHIAGYAGKRLIGLGRITALDPAGPYFENTDKRVRLNSDDALFVEVIHSDGTANLKLGLGLAQPLGHVDYYPNGGKDQPECPKISQKLLSGVFDGLSFSVDGLEQNLACSHMAAVYFYLDSIRNDACSFEAYKCASEDEFNSGKCLKCDSERGCNQMGYWSDPKKELGTLYLITKSTQTDKNSFCKQSFSVELHSNKIEKAVQTRGLFRIQLVSKSKKIYSIQTLDDSRVTFKPESVETRFVSFDEEINEEIDAVNIYFTKTSALLASWMYDSQWSFKYVYLWIAKTQSQKKYCPTKTVIESGSFVKFTKC